MQEKFMFYKNFLSAIEQLDESERAEACLALCRYGITGELPENPVFRFFCIGVSASVQKYDGRGGKREGAGRKPNNSNELSDIQKNQKNQNNQKNHNEQTETININYKLKTETEKEIEEKELLFDCPQSGNVRGCRFENSKFCLDECPDIFLQEAKVANPNVNPFDEYKVFKDYWLSRTGQIAVKKDWIATWRNWIRRCKGFTQKKSSEKCDYDALVKMDLSGGDLF